MKKKIALILICIVIVFSMPACSSEQSVSSASSIITATETKAEVFTAKATERATVAPTQKPTEQATEKPTEKATEKATEKPAEVAQTTVAITITSYSNTVSRNEMAFVEISAEPNTEYSISVMYSTGKSKASGLEKKTSDSNGNVRWEWKVGGKTDSGTYNITVTGGGQSTSTEFTVN